jgi:hypothetical protein
MYLSTKGNQMKSLKILKRTLEVVIHADRESSQYTALYKIKGLFDSLVLDGAIDFNSEHGQLIRVALDTKRKTIMSKNLIGARYSLVSLIEEMELEQSEIEIIEKERDKLAIDSTCNTVSVTCNSNKEVQLQLSNMPKKIGRPKSANSLTGAERAKRARDKKKANKLVNVNASLDLVASGLYKQMINSGYDLSSMVKMAYNQAPLGDKAC